jgi:hypothetical protein
MLLFVEPSFQEGSGAGLEAYSSDAEMVGFGVVVMISIAFWAIEQSGEHHQILRRCLELSLATGLRIGSPTPIMRVKSLSVTTLTRLWFE